MPEEKKELKIQAKQELGPVKSVKKGFEDEQENDVIMPRAKMLQGLSPELQDDSLMELNLRPGDVINSLTKEKLPNIFTPIFKWNSRVLWVPRVAGGGMACRALDARFGEVLDKDKFGVYNPETKQWDIVEKVENGDQRRCEDCQYGQWDGETPPLCTHSMNFLSMYQDQGYPIVTSFSNTSHKYGKKLYSIAKVMMQDMFMNQYKLIPKKVTNEKGTFFVSDIMPAGKTPPELIQFCDGLYNMYKNINITFDEDEIISGDPDSISNAVSEDM